MKIQEISSGVFWNKNFIAYTNYEYVLIMQVVNASFQENLALQV